MKFITYSLLMLCCFWANSNIALAAEIEATFAPSLAFQYDPFSGKKSQRKLTIELAYSGELSQNLEIVLKPVDEGDWLFQSEAGSIPLNINQTGSSGLQLIDRALIGRELVSSEKKAVTIEVPLVIPESYFAFAGNYSLELELDILNADTQEKLLDTSVINLATEVETKLQLNIAGSNSRKFEDGVDFTVIDFGELTTGESRRIFIQLRGNATAKVTVESEHDGNLTHTTKSNLKIPYSVTIDGNNTRLNNAYSFVRNPQAGLIGSSYPMTIIIGDVSKRFAGVYQDIINIDVSPD